MKTKITSLYITLLIAIAPLAVSAAKEDSHGEANHQLPNFTVNGISTLPIPVFHPIPSANRHLVGSTMEFKFRVDTRGKVTGVKLVKSSSPSSPNEMVYDYARQVTVALSKWKFEPALDGNEQPMDVKLRVPIKIVEKDNDPSAITASMSFVLEKGSRS